MSQSHQCFLQNIAGSLYRLHGQKIADLTIVFPNRRAGLFFTEYLNRIITGPVFSPEIITVQELFSKISPLHTEDQLQLIFRLYKIYKDLSGSKDSFDEFYLWGEMLLHDFDQVDKYLVDAELLFTNITDLKEIDEHFNDWNDERKEEIRHFWKSLNSGEQKRDQKEFARLWQVLYPVYVKFKSELHSGNIAYEGMLFRAAVENADSLSSAYLTEKKFIVAGFNALNNCEKKLFQSLKNRGNISFYWDFDQYYTDDPNQEAGLFMRENLRLFPQDDFPYDTDLLKSPKSIQILHTTSHFGQTQLAAGEIPHSVDKIDFDETAVVLCDEELLLPLLSSLPEEIDKVNVTMGLPLKQTPLFSLINGLISLQKKNKSEGGTCLFHYKSVLNILNNQLIQSAHPIGCKSIVENIVRNNLLYIPGAELCTTDLFRKIFVVKDSVSDLPDYFLAILYELFIFWENNKAGSYAINYQEYIYQIYVSVNKLNNTLFKYGAEIMGSRDYLSRDTFFKLLLQYLSALNITFEGEPLSGIQVMGILETRSLDFQNVILISVNEGIMPKANVSGSFIPYHLRKGVGLPTLEEQNAMYAYYFYRLLQRAERVTFIYNSGNNGLRTGEKSRFLYQLMLESPFRITETGHENSIDPVSVYPITVQKHGKVLEELNALMDSGRKISPSALDQYLHCPLSYYFKYISHFQEDDEVSEEVDARMFGKLYHNVMERLYLPFLNKSIDEKTVNSIIKDEKTIRERLNEAFNSLFFKLDPGTKNISLSGRNVLVFEVIQKMVVQTLRVDLKRTPFEIKGLEQKVDTILSIFGGRKAIRIGGIIDRIDYKSGVFEIIDYKTGTVEHVINTIPDLFDRESRKRNKAAFQTLVYGYIWDKTHPGSDGIFLGIYGLKKIFKEETNRLINREKGGSEVDYLEIKDQFEPMLKSLLEEIFNPELPFAQTTVEENCQYCNFASLCGKQVAQS